jgi:DNA/RNA-binding domain of Phe-tRNA-synthetase-like protein
MQDPPFEVTKELEGWLLFFAQLEVLGGDLESFAGLRSQTANRVRELRELATVSTDPVVAGMRRLFKAAGCDPTRHRPSSEALLRRILKGSEIPAIHPLVDLNNCLSAELAVPCCMMSEGTFHPPLVLRSGVAGESYESLKGPFNLEGKPLLLDTFGPLDAPITGSQRVKVQESTRSAWLVSYLPAEALTLERVDNALKSMLETLPGIRLMISSGC